MTGSTDTDVLPADTHLGRTALRVADLGETTDFYRTVVGLEVLAESGPTATLGVDGTPALVLEADADADPRGRATAGLFHNAFRVPTRGALGDALVRVRDDWQLDGASDHLVSEALYFTDPEGNGVEVYSDRPREEWPRTDDGGIRMATEPLDLDAVAAAAAGADGAPTGTRLGHVHLEVTSLDAFRDVYVDALGFEVQAALPAASFVSAGGYHHHVGANTWNRRTEPARGRGLAWFEVVVPGGDALAAVRTRCADRGVPVAETDDGLVVADPNGIEVRLRPGAPEPP